MPEKTHIEQSKLLSTYKKYLALFLKELNDKGALNQNMPAAPSSHIEKPPSKAVPSSHIEKPPSKAAPRNENINKAWGTKRTHAQMSMIDESKEDISKTVKPKQKQATHEYPSQSLSKMSSSSSISNKRDK